MQAKMNITEARRQFLSLPKKLAPGESVDIVRHRRTILKIVRPAEGSQNETLAILDEATAMLSEPKIRPPRSLATNYKKYLYGKKN
ncbi:MAG: hypothetical protein HY541_07605 [Deltaproteobacteria bacterium]|nr:hypothetical protein [Deltaproteobacteria bacterium]